MIEYQHLLRKEFSYKNQNCYHLVRDFYRDNYGIALPNYACPKDFWEHGINLYVDLAFKNGFSVIDCHPSQYQVGDVFMMAIQAPLVNHVGILVENGQMLHHLVGRMSAVEPYRSLYRNTTMAVMRHKDVRPEIVTSKANIRDLLPANVQRKIDAATA